jgi:hypothetical protein
MTLSKPKIDIEKFAEYNTSSADLESLVQYFLEGQIAYMESLDENELIEFAKDMGFYTEEDEESIAD